MKILNDKVNSKANLLFQLIISFVVGITLCSFFQVVITNASATDSSSVTDSNNTQTGTDEVSNGGTITINVDQHYDDKTPVGEDVTPIKVPMNEIGTDDFINRLKEAGVSSTKLLKVFPGLLPPISETDPNVTSIEFYGSDGKLNYFPQRYADLGTLNTGTGTGTGFLFSSLKYIKDNNNLKDGQKTGYLLVYYKPIKATISQMDSNGDSLGKTINFSLDIGKSLDNVNTDIDEKIQEVSDQMISEGDISNESNLKGSYYIETNQDGKETRVPITKDGLDKDISTLQNEYDYKDLSPISLENGKSVTKVLLQNLALIGVDNSQSYISNAESHEGKSIEIHLVYQPKKNSNSDNGAKNHESTNSGSNSSVSRNIDGIEDTIATYTKKPNVKVYDYNGNLITDRKLASGSNWYTDELMQLNGTKYYRVATNQWVKASDIYLYYNRTTKVRVNSDTLAELVTDEGKAVTDRALQKSSNWYTDEYKYINDIKYYRVATNEFVSTNDVQEY